MKLYILKQRKDVDYDETGAVVVRANSPRTARAIASQVKGDEGSDAWLDPKRTSCSELRADGPAAVVCRDFRAG